ncbi:MAG: serine hydrolase [Aridibacter sp.]
MRKLAAFLIFGLIFALFVFGQVPDVSNKQDQEETEQIMTDNNPSGVPEMTASDVGAFLDGIIPQQLAREDIAGATIAIVKDGKILFAKGYGYADVKNKKPVVAEETIFRPGSVAKLFTWTAVMQLHEQGKLDLDKDINEYLDFKIPDAFGKPITLKNLLTHTPGFEAQIKDSFTVGNETPDLGKYLKTHIPARIYPPGETPAYSNYGASLAGYIVERVSGQPYTEYVEEHIFKPLGMNHSTFVQPLPPNLAKNMSNGYQLGSGEPQPFEVVRPTPAGSLSSTADDLARFMLAHLQGGQLGDARILSPETTRLMHSRLFALDDNASGMCYGFLDASQNGHRILWHAGDTQYFHSNLHLIPDANVGFFISYNSLGKAEVSPRTMVWEAFLDRYFPYTPPEKPTLESAKQDSQAVSGTYISSLRSETSLFKAFGLIGEATVSANEDGTIEVSLLTGSDGKPKRWREVAPLQFREVGGQETIVFKRDRTETGSMELLFSFPVFTLQRVGLWENSSVLLPVLGISLLIMLLTLILWFPAWLIRRHYGQRLELNPLELQLRFAVRIVFAFNLIFIAMLVGLVAYATTNFDFLSDRGNTWFQIAQVIGVLGVIGMLVVFYNAVHAWMSKRYRIWGKLQATVFALACLGFLWFVLAGHLLYFSSGF